MYGIVKRFLGSLLPGRFSPLRHSDATERLEALNQYCVQHPEHCKAVLLEALEDTDFHVRERAVELLIERLDPQIMPVFLQRLSQFPGQQWRAGSIARNADLPLAEQIVRLLVEHSDPGFRSLIINILSYLPSDISRHTLRQVMLDPNEPIELRIKCTEALVGYADAETRAGLKAVAEDGPPELSHRAILSLGRIGEKQLLLGWLENGRSPDHKASCIEGLARCLEIGEFDLLHRHLTDHDSRLRLAAARAFGELYAPEALAPLIRQLIAPSREVQRRAAESLATLASEDIIDSDELREIIDEESMSPLLAISTLKIYAPALFDQ